MIEILYFIVALVIANAPLCFFVDPRVRRLVNNWDVLIIGLIGLNTLACLVYLFIII
jgi:hypothetical protein